MITIPDTGERILPEKETPLMIARHFSAYKFAGNYVLKRQVLDIGCGEGYGSYYLARFAREVLALDYSEEAIAYAKGKYKKDNLRFLAKDARSIDSFNNKFECICSFQFIEHIPDAGKFLRDVSGLLAPGGLFICSTPNKKDASPHQDTPANKFHVKEYLFNEFFELLKLYFEKVEISGLKRGRRLSFYRGLKKSGLLNFLPDSANPVKKFYNRVDHSDFTLAKDKLDTALDFIAVCSNQNTCR